MKQFFTILLLLLSMQTAFAQTQVVSEQKLKTGETVKMCIFNDGHYGYCTKTDENNAIKAYQSSKAKTKADKFNDGLNETVNTVNNMLNGVRTIGGYFGL